MLLSSEVGRLQEEVAGLRQRVQGYEADVEQLVATSELGHANPKQKIQYHLRSATILVLCQQPCICAVAFMSACRHMTDPWSLGRKF